MDEPTTWGEFRYALAPAILKVKIGIEELGYVGNSPNVWDGVPQDVLDDHGLSYDYEWITKCVDQEKRNDTAQWDEQGNLIS